MKVSIEMDGEEIGRAARKAAVDKGVPPDIAAAMTLEVWDSGLSRWIRAANSHAALPWRVRLVGEGKTDESFATGPYR